MRPEHAAKHRDARYEPNTRQMATSTEYHRAYAVDDRAAEHDTLLLNHPL